MMATFGEVKVGDVVGMEITAKVRITEIKPSEIAGGMRRFEFEIIDLDKRQARDIGGLVPIQIHEGRVRTTDGTIWVDIESGTWGGIESLRILRDMNTDQFGDELSDGDRSSYAEQHGEIVL